MTSVGHQVPIKSSNSAFCFSYLHLLLLLLFFAVLRGAWEINYPISLWNSSDDYPVMSLSHAIYLDERLTTDHPKHVGYSQTAHPGIPFQVISWVAYRLSSIGVDSGFAGRLDAVMSSSNLFFLAIKLIPVGVMIIVWGIAWPVITEKMPIYYALLLPLILYSLVSSFTYGFGYLGNDTFALPLGVALYLTLVRANAYQNSRWWLIAGLIGGLSYLNKLNYVMWSLGAVGGYILTSAYLRIRLLIILRNSFLYLSGFAVMTFVGGGLYLGWAGLNEMLTRHRGVMTHSGMYGTGTADAISLEVILENVKVSFSGLPFFWLLVLAAFAQAFWVLVSRYKSKLDEDWLVRNLPIVGSLIMSSLLVMLAVFKHYGMHYLIPLIVVVACLIWWSGVHATRGMQRIFIIPFLALALYASVVSALSSARSEQVQIAAIQSEVADIKSMPLGRGEYRLWTYHVSSKEYMQYFMSMLAESRWVSNYLDKVNPQDKPFDIFSQPDSTALDASGWAYVVFQNKYFLSQEKLPEYFRSNAVLIKRYDQLMVLKRVAHN